MLYFYLVRIVYPDNVTYGMGRFPSGQRGQTVNLLHIASVVRIHLHPVSRRGGTGRRTGLKILRDLYSRTGSIPVCGMILSERNAVKSTFLSLFCLLDIFAEKIKQMRISMLDQ